QLTYLQNNLDVPLKSKTRLKRSKKNSQQFWVTARLLLRQLQRLHPGSGRSALPVVRESPRPPARVGRGLVRKRKSKSFVEAEKEGGLPAPCAASRDSSTGVEGKP